MNKVLDCRHKTVYVPDQNTHVSCRVEFWLFELGNAARFSTDAYVVGAMVIALKAERGGESGDVDRRTNDFEDWLCKQRPKNGDTLPRLALWQCHRMSNAH